MSSISVLWQRAAASTRRDLGAMLAAQAIPAPNQASSFAWPQSPGTPSEIALGGQLLHLLPEDPFDQQPLWSPDRSCCLVADVRLDNRSDLIRTLHLTQPQLLPDSQILLQAWLRWGPDCLHHILGGFAFAVWTPARQEIFAARDHAGERPLFYHHSPPAEPARFALASMPSGLLALPGISSAFDDTRLTQALVLMTPDWNRSYFRDIQRLPPGHFLRFTPSTFEVIPYWHPSDAPSTRFQRDEDYVEAFLELFDRATEARLRSIKPIASELSSGLDSSSVASSAARILATRGQRLTAFTAVPRPGFHGKGFPGRLIDEGPGAADVARLYLNIDHILLDTRGCDLTATLHSVTSALDEPVQNAVNQLWVSAILQQASQRGIGVMLQGALGNATISYTGTAAYSQMFRSGHWIRLVRSAARMRRHGFMSIRGAASLATRGLAPTWLRRRLNDDLDRFTLDYSPINPALVHSQNLLQRMRDDFFLPHPTNRAERAHFFERFDYGPANAASRILYQVDSRDPCGDKRLFDFCYSIPLEQYIVGDLPRSLIRRAMRSRLPQSTLTRTLRGQQGADWPLTVHESLPAFQTELQAIQQSPTARRMLDLPRLQTLIKTWPASGYDTLPIWNSWNDALTRGISFGNFLRRHEP